MDGWRPFGAHGAYASGLICCREQPPTEARQARRSDRLVHSSTSQRGEVEQTARGPATKTRVRAPLTAADATAPSGAEQELRQGQRPQEPGPG